MIRWYPNLEYIVMDDGSTNDSMDIICKCRVARHEVMTEFKRMI